METAKISQLYDLGETIAAELFAGLTYPWEALPKISGFPHGSAAPLAF